jgi:hypothetical protein
MNEDSVLQEVRAARENYARSHDFDVRKIVADLQNLDRAGDWTVVRLAPRRPKVVRANSDRSNDKQPTGSAVG